MIHRARSAVGNSKVYVDVLVFASRILYGPINFGQSLRAHPDGRLRFLVDKNTKSPLVSLGSVVRRLFAW